MQLMAPQIRDSSTSATIAGRRGARGNGLLQDITDRRHNILLGVLGSPTKVLSFIPLSITLSILNNSSGGLA